MRVGMGPAHLHGHDHRHADTHHGHAHADADRGHADGHPGHTHGIVDPTIASTERGIWALKWSFVILAITAALQCVVVVMSGSVALLADTIHNVADAATAIPLWIAFLLARRKPSRRFTYGFGRFEDLAGLTIVAIILFSALVAGYQAIQRLLDPQPIEHLGWLAAAGVIGFVGNEAVALFRIAIGREINSVALVADGYHARTDGLTSLAVVIGAIGIWLGFPLADPIIGILITIIILMIVRQSAAAVLTRMLDGVDPDMLDDVRHAADHVAGIKRLDEIKARWIGHKLHLDVAMAVDGTLPLISVDRLTDSLRHELAEHLPALGSVHIRAIPTG